MNNYIQHLGSTAWRKKTTLLVAVGLLILILFGLQYTQNENDKVKATRQDKDGPQAIAASLLQNANVKFVDALQRQRISTPLSGNGEVDVDAISKLDASGRDSFRSHKLTQEEEKAQKEYDRQLGIPYVNLDTNNPYIPKKRVVHFDMKGAPLTVAFYKKVFPLIRALGATTVLLEYEDMFPYSGMLRNISAKNAYTVEQVREILKSAQESKLDVIPLIQTFGHVEFALKHAEWKKIREVPDSPQALCPSRNSSLDFVTEMVNQVMGLHQEIKYLHIGCDEVYQMGECEVCRLELHETLFLRHIKNVARVIHEKWPKLRLIIWDDMLRHLSQQSMQDIALGDIVEPMIWVYAEDIYRFVQTSVWDKYSAIFRTAWTASAFKGAFGETLYVPDAKRHLENNLRWLDVMSQQAPTFKHGFAGIVLTGWQRYDHFAVLCELFPSAIPSLALSLLAVSRGFFNSSLKNAFLAALSCSEHGGSGRPSPFINLDADPHLWDKIGRCMFPGSPIFRLTYRLHNAEAEALEYLRSVERQKGWLTKYNVRHNYSLPLRVDELTADLPRIYHGLLSLARSAADAMLDIFDNYTISEWVEQRIYPYIIQLEKIQNQSAVLKNVNTWPARPLPPLKDLLRLGLPIPEH